jgi:Arc/MetJ family transcription regulator
MRTTIVIDDQLMAEARAATGLKTKREVVELGLRTLVRLKRRTEIRNDRGKPPLAASLVGPDPQP